MRDDRPAEAQASTDPVVARRAAVAEICDAAARGVVDRVVTEATRATAPFGLTKERADRYAAGIFAVLPRYLAAMRMPDSPEREAEIGTLAREVRAVSDAHRIPRIVERGVTAIAVRIAREVIRRQAPPRGFSADELEGEFVLFADRLEQRLFSQ